MKTWGATRLPLRQTQLRSLESAACSRGQAGRPLQHLSVKGPGTPRTQGDLFSARLHTPLLLPPPSPAATSRAENRSPAVPGARQSPCSTAAPAPPPGTHTPRVSDLRCTPFGGWVRASRGTARIRDVTRWALRSEHTRTAGTATSGRKGAPSGDAEMGCWKSCVIITIFRGW